MPLLLLIMETDIICPYCGKVMEELDGKFYCENCGAREM